MFPDRDGFAVVVDCNGIWLGGRYPDGRIGIFNPAFCELTGYSEDEVRTLDWSRDVTPPEWREPEAKALQELDRTGNAMRYEKEYRRKNGTRVPIEVLVHAARDASGRVQYYYAFVTDITERTRASEALRASEARYRKLFEEATEGVVLADAETGEILDCSRAFLELSRHDRFELIGKPQAVLHPAEEGNPPVSRTFAQHREQKDGAVLPAQLVAKDGTMLQVEIKANVLEIGGRKVMQGFFRDVTAEARYNHEREMTLKLLGLLNDPNSTRELVRSLTSFLQQWSGCEAVGVRLREGDDFPYFETRGFPAEFVQGENQLCLNLHVIWGLRSEAGDPRIGGPAHHPYAEWAAQQIIDAFPYEEAPRFLLRDRDGSYGEYFKKRVEDMGIEGILIAPRSPWQNPFCERLVGSIRRKCLDHMIVLNEDHLRRILRSYFQYYHDARAHLSLERNSPVPREVEPAPCGKVISIPQVGGLHRRYTRAA